MSERNARLDRILGREDGTHYAAPPWAGEAMEPKPVGPAVRCLADVPAERVEWLWPGRLPLGKLAVIAGDPGVGKTMLTMDLAARVTTGAAWPDGAEGCFGSVLLATAEDGLADTLRPRLDAAGADVRRVSALEAVTRVSGDDPDAFTFADADMLERAIRGLGDCRLVVIDPVSAFYPPRTDTNSQSEIRGVLRPIASLAERTGCCVLLVSHLNKSQGGKSLYRISGSLALIAAARCGWLMEFDKDDRARRLFLPSKNNLSPDRGGLAYTVEGDPPRVVWEDGAVLLTADEALNASPGGESGITAACAWLEGTLSGGTMDSAEIFERAEQEGIPKRTLERAKAELGVQSQRGGFGEAGGWQWVMPGDAP